MRITKQIAEDVARQLCAEKQSEIKALKAQLKATVTSHYEAILPKDVLAFFKKYPSFVSTDSSVRIYGSGIDYRYFNFTQPMPSGDNCKLEIDDISANYLTGLLNTIQDQEKSYNQLLKEIQLALINLRTYNNVREQFPEAGKILPIQQTSTAVMVNVADIRCKLDKANCV